MMFCSCAASLLLLLLFAAVHALQKEEGRDDDPGLFSFVSRPDIRAPKWNLQVYHEDLLAPGYWFTAPYGTINQKTAVHGWVGPHIYDDKGELVWSGADMFSNGNVHDFRMSNVKGELLMTLLDQGPTEGVIFDHHYDIRKVLPMDHFNTHEFNFVENGTRVLIVKSEIGLATEDMSKAVGFNGKCKVSFHTLQELDVETWEPVFTWSSDDSIGLDESTFTEGSLDERCSNSHWDYLHANSIDKIPEGDFLFSGRHTDTIYKISKDTGEIIWRLGGTKSDFPINDQTKFSRQHDVRFRGQNKTHLLITILDNATGMDDTGPPSHELSRGLLLAISEQDMTASLEAHYDHPDGPGGYSPRRGNYQVLPNGNVFMGWSEQGVQSEHLPDGTVLMEAMLAVDWLGTYRQYKFPFVGDPTAPPDVHAEAIGLSEHVTMTVVHASWNGATEVASWNLCKTTKDGGNGVLLASIERRSFETVLVYVGFAKYVVVQALGSDGKVLGISAVFTTVQHHNITLESIEAEDQWLQEAEAKHDDNQNSSNNNVGSDGADEAGAASVGPEYPSHTNSNLLSNVSITVAFFLGSVCSAALLLLGFYLRRHGAFSLCRGTRYHHLRQARDPLYDYYSDSSPMQAWLERSSSREESLNANG